MKEYKYYYSLKHEKYIRECLHCLEQHECRIDGIPYTEAISGNETPMTNHFGDLILVHTGRGEVTYHDY